MGNRIDYPKIVTRAARSVLTELIHLLGEYRDDVVLIGGWVPDLLLPNKGHVGSTDVDLALNHLNLGEQGYKSILNLLLSRNYVQGVQPYIFERNVQIEGVNITVELDLMSGFYRGTGKRRRHQRIQDVLARKVRGCELAFEMNQEIEISEILPDGGRDTVIVKVASIIPFFVMKGLALYDRLKEKDAWDIYFCIKNFPGGVEKLVEIFRPYLDNSLVNEGLKKIQMKFSGVDMIGPKQVADFELIENEAERELIIRDAFEQVNHLLNELGIISQAD